MSKLFKNEEVKRITYIFTILHIIILLFAYVLLNASINNLNSEYIMNNKVLASRLLAQSPGAEAEIMKAFTKDISIDEVKNSESILNDYGYNDKLEYYKNPVIYKFSNSITIKALIFITAIGLLFYFIVIKELSRVFIKIKELSNAAEALVEGDFSRVLPDDKEGDFYILGYQFNIMARRFKESLNRLETEKLHLKTSISDISHQMKTPMSALIMFNEIMESDEEMDAEERKNFLRRSTEQLYRMEWLIKNLLKLARLESGVVEFKRENSPLDDTIEKAIAPLELQAKEKYQQIIIKGHEKIMFKHDTDWTAEALINIIKNAIEHTKTGGEIEIKTEETPLSVQIYIKDNGEGISKEELPRIFKRFYKGDSSTNPTSIGIGLALSKLIIEAQGGSITVTSEAGKGTEFNITFLKTVV